MGRRKEHAAIHFLLRKLLHSYLLVTSLVMLSVALTKPQHSAHEEQHHGLLPGELSRQHPPADKQDAAVSKSGSTEQTAEIKLQSEERSEQRCYSA